MTARNACLGLATGLAAVLLTAPTIPSAQARVIVADPAPGSPAAVAAQAALTAPPDRLPRRWRGHNLTHLPTRERVVALTLDCGSSNTGVRSILRTLRRKKVAATFFVTGDFARLYPRQVRTMLADGHTIGNHSTTHPDFADLGKRQQRREIRRANRLISARTGVTTKPWFRYPYGSYTAASVRLANSLGYATIGWTVDTLGWMGTSGGHSARSVRARAVAAARPGEIILMHVGATPGDNSTLDADALPGIIRKLRARGYDFVRLQTTIGAGTSR